MPLNIPEKHREVLSKYSKIPTEKRKELFDFLNSEEIFGLALEKIPTILGQQFQGIDIDFEKLIEVFYSVSRSLVVYKKEKNLFIDEILTSLSNDKVELHNDIRNDLVELFNSPLAIISKSIGLYFENDKIFSDARILTDLRPVFNDEKETKVIGGIIVHSLKIVYKGSDGSDKEFFVVMAPAELKTLKDQIIRAESKETELKKSLADNFRIIDLKV